MGGEDDLATVLTCSLGDDTSERRLRRGVEVDFGVVDENDGSIATMWRRKYVEHRLESGTAVL